MTKYLCMMALLVTISIGAKAQFSLGVKGGLNLSKINTDNVNESALAGYQAGLFARIGSGIYLQPELYLSSTGGKFDYSEINSEYAARVKFTNLNIPLLLGKSFGSQDLNFRIMAGPVYTYVLDTKENFTSQFSAAYQDLGHYNNSTLGFQAGAGVDIGPITADLRYEGGLIRINQNYGQRQNLWALSAGFKIL